MSDEQPVCPSCNQELVSYRDGCGVCGWQGMLVQIKQEGIILHDLGDKLEIALNDGSVGVYSQLYVYPSVDPGDVCDPNFPLEKSRKRSASGTLYSYIATRHNKKGIEKQYQYWAYTGLIATRLKTLRRVNGRRRRNLFLGENENGLVTRCLTARSSTYAQKKPVSYILSILDRRA